MEKLSIEMLSPYLPYGLKGIEDESEKVHELLGLNGGKCLLKDCNYQRSETFIITEFTRPDYWQPLKDFTPLLRPMSEFTIESEAYKEMAKHLMNLHADTNIANWTMYLDSMKHSSYKDLHYWQVQILAKHHFDFQNLLGRNLAKPIINDNLKEK